MRPERDVDTKWEVKGKEQKVGGMGHLHDIFTYTHPALPELYQKLGLWGQPLSQTPLCWLACRSYSP